MNICHLIQRHVWHISQNLSSLTRRRSLWVSKGHVEYTCIPCMLEKQSWKEDEKTSQQYKIIRLRILFADNWSQICTCNISPFSFIHGIWNNAGFRHMAWFAVFPVIVHRRCVTLSPCKQLSIVYVVSIQPIFLSCVALCGCYFKEKNSKKLKFFKIVVNDSWSTFRFNYDFSRINMRENANEHTL